MEDLLAAFIGCFLGLLAARVIIMKSRKLSYALKMVTDVLESGRLHFDEQNAEKMLSSEGLAVLLETKSEIFAFCCICQLGMDAVEEWQRKSGSPFDPQKAAESVFMVIGKTPALFEDVYSAYSKVFITNEANRVYGAGLLGRSEFKKVLEKSSGVRIVKNTLREEGGC